MSDPVQVLSHARSLAVVGCSATPGKDAHEVPKHMLAQGYELYPVNPSAKEIFGKRVYASLADVPRPIELVNVFRPAEEAPGIARQAVELGARALWLQTGIRSPEARRIAEDAGLEYVEDACVRVVQRMLQR
ncbi:MAG TPA: CoA-binding protein [Candidatus Thermoplasmatota archaeon]|nr:CoA-binding protein [Candidatus Thermoplasmatota archaeon]